MAQRADEDGLTVYWGDRLDRLAQMFADNLESDPKRDPFAPEQIVVGSRVAAGWLRQFFLFERQGGRQRVLANWDIQFLYIFVNDWLHRISPTVDGSKDEKRDPSRHPYAPGVLQWRLYRLLQGDLLDDPACETLLGYLGPDPTPARRFELAGVVARLFDEYQVYRPSLLHDWQQGRGVGDDLRDLSWQPRLWHALVEENAASYLQQFLRLRDDLAAHPEVADLGRVNVFGISAMPVVYIAFFRELSRYVPVNIYVFNPSREHWFDQVDARRQDAELIRLQGDVDPEDLYLKDGNPLLVALGRSNQHYLNELLNVAEAPDLLGGGFAEDQSDSLLHHLQADIRNDAPLPAPAPLPPTEAEHSLRIEICHSPQREVEVLHDQLLAWFAADPTIQPRDIQVQLADMATYMPYIDATFATINARGERSIPYVVADRFVASESQVARAFCTLLRLPASRFAASEVLDLLESEGVSAAFEMTTADVAHVRNWVRDSAIRWGLDRRHRHARSDADFESTATWEQGLQRLILGYALGRSDRDRQSPLWDAGQLGVLLPFDAAEGDSADLIGRLVRFVYELRRVHEAMSTERSPADWQPVLSEMVDRFFVAGNDNYADIAVIRRTIRMLGDTTAIAGIGDTPVAGDVIARYLADQIGQAESQDSLSHNALVVTALRPMSSTPRRFQCLLGMSDGVYPRQDLRTQFDLIARRPHRGDPLRRWQDRQAVLETVMSAKDRLYLSYVGRSLDGNDALPPSTIVTEIRDYLVSRFDWSQAESAATWDGSRLLPFERLHHLQAFHSDYFRGRFGLQSYSRSNCAAAAAIATPQAEPLTAPTIILAAPTGQVAMHELQAFYRNPAKSYYQNTLHVRFDAETFPLVDDREPFELQGLPRYSARQAVLAAQLRQSDPLTVSEAAQAMLYEQLKQQGLVPLGDPGWSIFRDLWQEISEFATTDLPGVDCPLHELVRRPRRRESLRLAGGARELEGSVEFVDAGEYPLVLHYRYADSKPKEWLRGWLEHLLAASAERPARTLIVGGSKGQPETRLLAPLGTDEARAALAALVALHHDWRARPMPFTPATSYAWWQVYQKDGDLVKAREAARKAWTPNNRSRQDGEDPYFSRAFGFEGPMGRDRDTFEAIARIVFDPLAAAEEES